MSCWCALFVGAVEDAVMLLGGGECLVLHKVEGFFLSVLGLSTCVYLDGYSVCEIAALYLVRARVGHKGSSELSSSSKQEIEALWPSAPLLK